MQYIKKFFTFLILICTVMCLSSVVTAESATDEISLIQTINSDTCTPNDTLSIKYSFNSNTNTSLSFFKITVHFDTNALTFNKINKACVLSDGILRSSVSDNCLSVIYLKKSAPFQISQNSDTEIFSVVFNVNSNISLPYKACIEACIGSVISSELNYINTKNPEISELLIDTPKESDSSLEALVPSVGKLLPDFSPNTLNYYMEVDSTTKSIEFDAVPVDKSCTVKVNRKNLLSKGSTTDFKITSYATDGSYTAYYVSVYRRNDEEKQNTDDDSKSTTSSSKQSTATSQNKTSSVKQSSTASSKASSASSKQYSTAVGQTGNNTSSSFRFSANTSDTSENPDIDNSKEGIAHGTSSLILGNSQPNIAVIIFIILLILFALILIFGKREAKHKPSTKNDTEDNHKQE